MITGPTGPTMGQLFGDTEAPPADTEAGSVPPVADSVIETLAAAGYETADDIAAADDGDLLALPGIGAATLEQIRIKIG